MNGISKTLNEMTIAERTNLLDTVADALEATADEAEEAGDSAFVANSTCVASTIRGLCGDLGGRDLEAAELLLEQGIVMMPSTPTDGRRPRCIDVGARLIAGSI